MKNDRVYHRGTMMPNRKFGNRSSRFAFGLTAIVTMALASAAAAQPAPTKQNPLQPATPIGVWFDDTGRGAVEIMPCGDQLCGRIVWLKDPNSPEGQPLTDALNPDPRKRNRPICGLQVIGDLQLQPDGTWDHGWVYDPKEGKSYDVEISLRSPDHLQVKGYMGVKFLSETFVWRRAPAELQRCVVPALRPGSQATAR